MTVDFLASIGEESDRFYAIAETADPSRPVPSCPGWSIADLVWHLGEVHSFWATIVELRLDDSDEADARQPDRPSAYEDVVAFGRAQAERLLAALRTTDAGVAVWTWALDEKDHTVGFVRRHQVQEAAVHRWDLQQAATGAADGIAADAAVDSIDEMLAITLPWCVRADKPLAGSVHIHCTDTDTGGAGGEWIIQADGRVEPVHAKGDAALRGTSSDLLLVLFKRLGLDRVEVIGNSDVARQLVSVLNTE